MKKMNNDATNPVSAGAVIGLGLAFGALAQTGKRVADKAIHVAGKAYDKLVDMTSSKA